jgi:hypothetical protein
MTKLKVDGFQDLQSTMAHAVEKTHPGTPQTGDMSLASLPTDLSNALHDLDLGVVKVFLQKLEINEGCTTHQKIAESVLHVVGDPVHCGTPSGALAREFMLGVFRLLVELNPGNTTWINSSIDHCCETVFLGACRLGTKATIEFLLEHGADRSAVNQESSFDALAVTCRHNTDKLAINCMLSQTSCTGELAVSYTLGQTSHTDDNYLDRACLAVSNRNIGELLWLYLNGYITPHNAQVLFHMCITLNTHTVCLWLFEIGFRPLDMYDFNEKAVIQDKVEIIAVVYKFYTQRQIMYMTELAIKMHCQNTSEFFIRAYIADRVRRHDVHNPYTGMDHDSYMHHLEDEVCTLFRTAVYENNIYAWCLLLEIWPIDVFDLPEYTVDLAVSAGTDGFLVALIGSRLLHVEYLLYHSHMSILCLAAVCGTLATLRSVMWYFDHVRCNSSDITRSMRNPNNVTGEMTLLLYHRFEDIMTDQALFNMAVNENHFGVVEKMLNNGYDVVPATDSDWYRDPTVMNLFVCLSQRQWTPKKDIPVDMPDTDLRRCLEYMLRTENEQKMAPKKVYEPHLPVPDGVLDIICNDVLILTEPLTAIWHVSGFQHLRCVWSLFQRPTSR